ncbi:MAG: 3-oxoacyl-ACP reductase FabG [Actinobacteria bacterium]|nr:3-oxoacyl-ACP reductase FabG [Actinomycetota bacterium]
MRLEGKVALITGGSRGIGRALALGFAAEGALVHVNHFDDASDVVAQLGGESLDLRYDVGDRAQVAEMFSRLDRLDVLVNCAGITGWTPFADTTADAFDAVIATNLKGTYFCSQEAARLMDAGGAIVNVSSVVGSRAIPNLPVYGASKAGIEALTKHLAAELAPRGIRVNAFAPGSIDTERNLADDPEYASRWAPHIPLGRIGEPEEMVGPAVFLASAESSYVTGQCFFVDGGWTLVSPFPAGYVDAASDRNIG